MSFSAKLGRILSPLLIISIKIRIIILFSFTSDKDILPPVVPEDKVMFGVHAHAISLMTVAKIRKVYNKVDAKTIAKQV